MANNIYKTLGSNAQTLTILATVCLEDPVTQEKAKSLLDKALAQRPDYTKAVVKKAELLSTSTQWSCCLDVNRTESFIIAVPSFVCQAESRSMRRGSRCCGTPWPIRATASCTGCWEISWWQSATTKRPWTSTALLSGDPSQFTCQQGVLQQQRASDFILSQLY